MEFKGGYVKEFVDRLPLASLRQNGRPDTFEGRFRFEESRCLFDESQEVVQQAWDKVQHHDPGGKLMSVSGMGDWDCYNGKETDWVNVISSQRCRMMRVFGTGMSQESSQLEMEAVTQMDKEFTNEEIKHCLFTMNGSKAPGPDGMLAKFLQHN
ncbi:hypothetical protein LIER_42838 [Lithospermum erythrorhizon]|uniref:Uncharacterized protein n=1 Tax=Lithospermum erythrorhizon TaxID=34254 RepID=A0AAV3P2W4_LITER